MAHLKEQVVDDEAEKRDHDKAQKGQVAPDQVKKLPKSRAEKRYDNTKKKDDK